MALLLMQATFLFSSLYGISANGINTGSANQTTTTSMPTTSDRFDETGYWCYSCRDNSDDHSCREGSGLLDVQKAVRKIPIRERPKIAMPSVQNCMNWANFCVIIETTDVENKLHDVYSRECSSGDKFQVTFQDGKLFVLNTTGSRLEPHLHSKASPPSNHTVCLAGSMGIQVCVTLCQGDFCNGPLYKQEEKAKNKPAYDDAASSVSQLHVVAMMSALVVSCAVGIVSS